MQKKIVWWLTTYMTTGTPERMLWPRMTSKFLFQPQNYSQGPQGVKIERYQEGDSKVRCGGDRLGTVF